LAAVRRLTESGRLTEVRWLAKSWRLALEKLPLSTSGAIPEEPRDDQQRQDEHVKEDQVVPAPEEEQQVQPIAQENDPQQATYDPPLLSLATADTRDHQHRNAATNEE
jgi:hypothetical protein